MKDLASCPPKIEPETRPWPNIRWWSLPAGLGLGIVMIVADDRGYGGVFEWSLVFTLGTGFAIATFWHKRASRWYWPAVLFIVAIHFAALCMYPWKMIPSANTGTFMALKGAAGLDFAADALFLYLLHLFIDPPKGSRTHATNLVIAAIILFNIGVFGGVCTLVMVRLHNNKVALSQSPAPNIRVLDR